MVPKYEYVEEVNIGVEEQPRIFEITRTMMKEYLDVFAWSDKDLKPYGTSIIPHTTPINKDEMPFKQKLRRINPRLFPLVEKEIKKLFEVKIIVSL